MKHRTFSLRHSLTRVLLILLSLAATGGMFASDPAIPDVTGIWDFTVETDSGSGNPVFTFKQDRENLTGTYKGYFGEASVQGKVQGQRIEFAFTLQFEGSPATMTYTGTVNGESMKGTVTFGSIGNGTWTAKRRPK